MKIPENPGAYYPTEDSGQWQPNGMVMEGGAGGGDAGFAHPAHPAHYPPPPRHMPQPGYVLPGPYYPAGFAAPAPEDFSDYMWMEDEEDFDKQVMQQLEEEALMEQCIEAMLQDEQRGARPAHAARHRHGGPPRVTSEQISRSTLNPLAAEFVPTWTRATHDKSDIPAVSAAEVTKTQPEAEPVTETEATQPEEPELPAPSETESQPQTAEDLPDQPEQKPKDTDQEKRPKDKKEAKRVEVKKVVKAEVKKTQAKPQAVKSEPKLPVTKKEVKKEVKLTKSVEEVKPVKEEAPAPAPVVVAETLKPVAPLPPLPLPPAPEEPPGPKPVNYAAAARANKPKKASTPPVELKPTAPPAPKPEKTAPKTDKPSRSADKTAKKPIARKNSTK